MNLVRSLSCSAEKVSTMTPMELFEAQFTSHSSEARVDAMRRIVTVGEALGPELTAVKLIPYLSNSILTSDDIEEDDEILLVLAEQLGRMVPGLIPGHKALPILSILERLAGVEETVVREQACISITKIVPELLRDQEGYTEAPALLLGIAKRLSGAEWFTSKVSAAGVLGVIYTYFHLSDATSKEEAKRELRIMYRDLAEDDAPMVRRNAAKYLGGFVQAVAGLSHSGFDAEPNPIDNKSIVLEDVVPLFHVLCHDEQDSVRLLAVVASGDVAVSLSKDSNLNSEFVLPIVRNGCVDLSWRVRNNLAKNFAPIAKNMNFPVSSTYQTELFLCFSGLLQDSEAEVRGAAVSNVAELTQLGGCDLFSSHIAPFLPPLADDPVMEVRSRLAQSLMDCVSPSICSCLSDKIILQTFRPLLENFLNDEFPEVQLHILTKLSLLSSLLSKMDVVVNHLLQMTKAANWRVREAVAQLLPHLAEAMGLPFFEDHLLEPWLNMLLDKVSQVRNSCVQGMPKLLAVAGPHWIQNELLLQYKSIYDDSTSYLTRITVLRSYAALLCHMHPQLLEEVITQLLKGLKDKVANVRMISAKGIHQMYKQEKEVVSGVLMQTKIIPALTQCIKEEEDEDCRYFVQLALDTCSG